MQNGVVEFCIDSLAGDRHQQLENFTKSHSDDLITNLYNTIYVQVFQLIIFLFALIDSQLELKPT